MCQDHRNPLLIPPATCLVQELGGKKAKKHELQSYGFNINSHQAFSTIMSYNHYPSIRVSNHMIVKTTNYPLVNSPITMERSTIFNG